MVDENAVAQAVMARTYEHFMEDHTPKPWTPGKCAGYAGRGSLATHMFRCKGPDGQGVGGLFCRIHADSGRDNGEYERELILSRTQPVRSAVL